MYTFINQMDQTKLHSFKKISQYSYNNTNIDFNGFTPIFTFTISYNPHMKICNYCLRNNNKYFNILEYEYYCDENIYYKIRDVYDDYGDSCNCDNPIHLIGNIIVSGVGNPIKTTPDETIYKIDFQNDFCFKSELNNFFYRYDYGINTSKLYNKTTFSVYNSMDENDEISKKIVDDIFNLKYFEFSKYVKNVDEHKLEYDLNIYGNIFQDFVGNASIEKYYLCFIDIIKNIMKSNTEIIEKKENPHIGKKKTKK